MSSPIVITARHFVKRAPSSRYSFRRSRRPSRPSVIFSSGALACEEQVAIRAPVLLGRLDVDGVEAFLDRAGALVGGEDALAGSDESARGALEIAHSLPSICPAQSLVRRAIFGCART